MGLYPFVANPDPVRDGRLEKSDVKLTGLVR